ncbi:MAG: ATP-grasp domain-containing protein [Coxiellaceae bacterium]|nr:ATP-grasp domain-containing protein [Coxiellaceae bacterium]
MTEKTTEMTKQQIAVIVDAYSTGRFLAQKFQQQGFQCVHVQTHCNIPDIFSASFQLSDFIVNLVITDELSDVVEQLKLYRPQIVVAGTESGVGVADQLNSILGLRGNSTELSASRFNKFEMIKALQAANVPSVECIKSSSVDEVIEWLTQHNMAITVIKPIQSAGNDGVYFCQSSEAIANAINCILSKNNIFGDKNLGVLAQRLLTGTEYIVNSVSNNGNHRFTDIWRCEKTLLPTKSNLSLLEALVSPDDPVVEALIAYAELVLNALDIEYGPGHLEIMLTDQGPVLIEAAARLQGCVDVAAVELATGLSQLSQMVLSYLDPEAFKATDKKYQLKQHCYRLFMKSNNSGYLNKNMDLSVVEQLPSFYSVNTSLKKHEYLSETVDIATTPGYLHFVNENPQQMQEDYLVYREYEEKQLFSPDILVKSTSDYG